MPVTSRVSSVSAQPFQIRAAGSKDLTQLCELAGQLLSNIRARGTSDDAKRVFDYIMHAEDRGLVVVAEDSSGALRGYAYASYVWRAEFGGETMDIIALFVAPQWRGKGVGSGLIAGLVKTAKERGIYRISAEVHPGNSAIERTLESCGFDPERRTLWGYLV